jgi:hypothetical protein
MHHLQTQSCTTLTSYDEDKDEALELLDTYQNARYLHGNKDSHGDTIKRPLSVEVTSSRKLSCILIANHTTIVSRTKETSLCVLISNTFRDITCSLHNAQQFFTSQWTARLRHTVNTRIQLAKSITATEVEEGAYCVGFWRFYARLDAENYIERGNAHITLMTQAVLGSTCSAILASKLYATLNEARVHGPY